MSTPLVVSINHDSIPVRMLLDGELQFIEIVRIGNELAVFVILSTDKRLALRPLVFANDEVGLGLLQIKFRELAAIEFNATIGFIEVETVVGFTGLHSFLTEKPAIPTTTDNIPIPFGIFVVGIVTGLFVQVFIEAKRLHGLIDSFIGGFGDNHEANIMHISSPSGVRR
jgi:hypothetical protein